MRMDQEPVMTCESEFFSHGSRNIGRTRHDREMTMDL